MGIINPKHVLFAYGSNISFYWRVFLGHAELPRVGGAGAAGSECVALAVKRSRGFRGYYKSNQVYLRTEVIFWELEMTRGTGVGEGFYI